MKNRKRIFLTLCVVLVATAFCGIAAYAESVFSGFGCNGVQGMGTIDYDAKTIECYLSEPINTIKLKKSSVTLLNGEGEACTIGEVGYSKEENALIIIPDELKSNMTYTVSLQSELFGSTEKELAGSFLTAARDLEITELELQNNGGYRFNITAKNSSDTAQKFSIVYVVYQNGILVDAGGRLIEVGSGQTLPESIEVGGVSTGQTVRAVVWTAEKEKSRIMESRLFSVN